jgi:predicted alpha-1,2-mannosidase
MRTNIVLPFFFPALLLAQDVTGFVDPFIGTADGGNTFPGAVLPWGMVSVSPHTAPGTPSGYLHNSDTFYGFGHVHLSGTGCSDLGSVIITATRGTVQPQPEIYRSTLRDQFASPGYYRAIIPEIGVLAEATVTTRCGLTRFRSQEGGNLNILIDAGRSLNLVGGGAVAFRSESEVEGFNISGGFCGESNRQTVYFSARLSRTPNEHGVWSGNNVSSGTSASAKDSAVGAWMRLTIPAGESVMLKVGISYVSIDNARQNRDQEIPGWDFDRVRHDARAAWQRELEKVHVEGDLHSDMVKFYTALYHMLIHPNIISDANGDYPLMGHKGTGHYARRDRYTVFSLWDTYRTLHPFLTLVYPERQSAIVQTMIDMYKESGWLPKWELAANETYMMSGDPAVPVVADTWLKGIRDFDIEAAYAACRKPAMTPGPESDPIRPGYHEDLKYGYIPFEQDTNQAWWVWGPASTTLEYCFSDWALAQLARSLHKDTDFTEFSRRSSFYRNLFDTATQFIRPRRSDGSWLTPFDPLQTEGSGSWSGSGGPGYVEGNAWQYTWFVPHDIKGLIELFGGREPFVLKLAECFRYGQFTINNEPDIAYPYLFTYFPGEESRTRELAIDIMRRQFGTGASGLPGNDDAGAISAWFAFSALGLYPACPASTEYRLGIPLFRRAVIRLHPAYYTGKEFVILNDQAKGEREASFRLNGKVHARACIDHQDVVAGGELRFITY